MLCRNFISHTFMPRRSCLSSKLLRVQTSFYSKRVGLKQVNVDSFTLAPFKGNPAAVVLTETLRENEWMQNMATENNFPVTAFVSTGSIQQHLCELRWFTPTQEISLCGHATLAAAHVIYESQLVPHSLPISFQTKGLVLEAKRESNASIKLDFPSTLPLRMELTSNETDKLTTALQISSHGILYTGHTDVGDLIVELTPQSFLTVPKLVNYTLLSSLGGRGVVITAYNKTISIEPFYTKEGVFVDMSCDIWLRGFYPNIGLNEDHATGSALCALAPYYAYHPTHVFPSSKLKCFQASVRGGHSIIELFESETHSKGSRVSITGHCVTVSHIEVLV